MIEQLLHQGQIHRYNEVPSSPVGYPLVSGGFFHIHQDGDSTNYQSGGVALKIPPATSIIFVGFSYERRDDQHILTRLFPSGGMFYLLPSGAIYPSGMIFPSGLFPSGMYPSGVYPSGLFPSGLYPSGLFPSGLFPSGLFPSGIFPSGLYPSGIYPSGLYPSGLYPSGLFTSGIFPFGQIPNNLPWVTYPPGIFEQSIQYPPYPSWLFPSGVFPSGLYPSGLFPSGLFPSGLWPSGLFPSGLFPSGIYPSGLYPSGLFPSGIFPSGLFPSGLYPSGLLYPGLTGLQQGGAIYFPSGAHIYIHPTKIEWPMGVWPSGILLGSGPQAWDRRHNVLMTEYVYPYYRLLPIVEYIEPWSGIGINERIVVDKRINMPIVEKIIAYLMVKGELIDFDTVKIAWEGDRVPKIDVYEELTTNPWKMPRATVDWETGYYIFNIDDQPHKFKVKAPEGESKEIIIGMGKTLEVDGFLDLGYYEKAYAFDMHVIKRHRIEVRI